MSFRGQAIQRTWHLIDGTDQTVGRLASSAAQLLRGKHKPTFSPHQDCGDYVVVVNADKVHFSGKKWAKKLYRWHTGYPGGLKQRTATEMLAKRPDQVLRKAVLGMLKRTNLRHRHMEPRLLIYPGPHHPHAAQLGEHAQPLPALPRKLTEGYSYGWKSRGGILPSRCHQEGRRSQEE